MNSKFKIKKHRHCDNLHLRLVGEFNDNSVCDLIDVLKSNSHEVDKMFIHTSRLDNINMSSIGKAVFHRNLNYLNGARNRVEFTGYGASQIMPEKGFVQ